MGGCGKACLGEEGVLLEGWNYDGAWSFLFFLFFFYFLLFSFVFLREFLKAGSSWFIAIGQCGGKSVY